MHVESPVDQGLSHVAMAGPADKQPGQTAVTADVQPIKLEEEEAYEALYDLLASRPPQGLSDACQIFLHAHLSALRYMNTIMWDIYKKHDWLKKDARVRPLLFPAGRLLTILCDVIDKDQTWPADIEAGDLLVSEAMEARPFDHSYGFV